MAPKLLAEALRFPGNGQLSRSSPGSGGSAVELRTGLTYSPTDAVRGHLVQRVAAADCAAHAAGLDVDAALLHAAERAELLAHRAEAEQLAARRSAWQASL